MSTKFQPFKYRAVCFTEKPESIANIISLMNAFNFTHYEMSDPREFIKRFKTEIPLTCIIDLDVSQSKEAIALFKSLRNIYASGILMFGLSSGQDNELTRYVKANGINDIFPKNIDKASFETRYLEVIDKKYSSTKEQNQVTLPAIVEWYFEKASPQLSTISHNIENIDVLETRVKFYEERLLPYREYFLPMVKSLAKSQEALEYTQAIRLYGVNNAKNLLVAFTLAETLKSEALKWNEKTNLPTMDPKNYIQYAVKTLNAFGEDSRYAQVAFNAGLVFDFLFYSNEVSTNKNPAIKKLIETRYDIALQKAKAGYKKASTIKDLSFEKQIITYFLFKEAGKIAIAIHQPDYIDFNNSFEKAGIKPLLFAVAEKHRFGISHSLVGSLFAQIMPDTGDAASSVLFADHAFLFNNDFSDHDSYTLTEFCSGI